jgi:hypothetical protein
MSQVVGLSSRIQMVTPFFVHMFHQGEIILFEAYNYT